MLRSNVIILKFFCRLLFFLVDSPRIVNTEWLAESSHWPVYGEPLIRICPLESNPPAHYSWKRHIDIDINSPELDISTDVKFTNGGRQMEIAAYQPDLHNGLYVCTASNTLGSEEYVDTNLFYLKAECKQPQMLHVTLIIRVAICRTTMCTTGTVQLSNNHGQV